jgi:outer membrane protein OmpA-like peptidoglycan-associated protein
VVLASGSAVTVAAGASAVSERLVLNAAGVKAAGAAGGVTVTLRATITPLSGPVVTATATFVVVKKTTTVTLLGGILFSSNSAKLSTSGKTALIKIARQVAGSKSLECDGYTASTGNPTGEYKLGLQRAAAVCAFIKNEIKLLHLRAITLYIIKSFGATHPVSRTNQALNRRVQLIVRN